MRTKVIKLRQVLVSGTWRLMGGLSTLGPRLTALSLVTLALLASQVPSTPPMLLAPLLPSESASVGRSSETPPDPAVAQVDDILARKAPGLGLAVRGQLSSALVEEAVAAKLDPLLVLAVMRVESEFDDEATSVRGARGLMQMRPTTLAFIARQQGIRLPVEEILRDPVLSTRLAVRYLGRLNLAFHGDLDAALMAYNAGPHRISFARAEHDADRFLVYPRNVRRAWRHLRALPPSDDQTVAERDLARR